MSEFVELSWFGLQQFKAALNHYNGTGWCRLRAFSKELSYDDLVKLPYIPESWDVEGQNPLDLIGLIADRVAVKHDGRAFIVESHPDQRQYIPVPRILAELSDSGRAGSLFINELYGIACEQVRRDNLDRINAKR